MWPNATLLEGFSNTKSLGMSVKWNQWHEADLVKLVKISPSQHARGFLTTSHRKMILIRQEARIRQAFVLISFKTHCQSGFCIQGRFLVALALSWRGFRLTPPAANCIVTVVCCSRRRTMVWCRDSRPPSHTDGTRRGHGW